MKSIYTDQAAPEIPKLLLSVNDAAHALSICPKSLWSKTSPRGPINAIKIGARVLYPVTALEAFVRQQAEAQQQAGMEGSK